MLVTSERIALLVRRDVGLLATQLAAAIDEGMPRFGITTSLECAHFMAQACHETGGFQRFEENLHYTDPARLDAMFSAIHGEADAALLIRRGPEAIANRAYAGRNGNGDELSGDGWRYRGRGCFQLTGRANYATAGKAVGHDYAGLPDLVAQPAGAALTALNFWHQHGCNALAAAGDVEGVTRVINGPGLVGLAERIALTERAKEIFV